MKNIIINADDFGKNKEVNLAIMALMDSNLCMDTTLLVNFEDSAQAADLATSTKKKNNVGIHLNLTEGFPLTAKIRNESRFCDKDGLFHYNKVKRIVHLTSSEKKAVQEELTSQIQLCRKLGIPISHADSHNHVHEEPGMLLLLIDILRKENIPFLRLTNNIEKTSFVNRFYRDSYNSILYFHKLTRTDYFGSTLNLRNYKKPFKENSIIELMVHPGQIINNQIYDVYSKENLSLHLPGIIEGNRLTSYHQFAK
ncbi:MAG: ChbG/HpnK family deacetylase [Bacteroidota bacterium]|nr:ChbG/HpnK family deacetylase [Bacteroidota bacterium]